MVVIKQVSESYIEGMYLEEGENLLKSLQESLLTLRNMYYQEAILFSLLFSKVTPCKYLLFFVKKRIKGYLVDPASNDMLVSKIKPCKSKYKSILLMKLRTAH
jgi:hypothetical protein